MQRVLFTVGMLAAIVLVATDVALGLRRLFPDSLAPNLVGPFIAITGVLLFRRHLTKRS